MTTKKMKIHVVSVTLPGGKIEQFYVKHYSSSQARAWLIDNAVEARVADQDDVLAMATQKVRPIGPNEPQADIESEIDRTNAENAADLTSNGDGGPTGRFDMEPPVDER